MQPIPVPVTNVSVYPYTHWDPHWGVGPVQLPVITGAEGTYSVGTLITHIFYNLDLQGGKHEGTLNLGGQYYASFKTSDGGTGQTPWMYCTQGGDSPTFGRTETEGTQITNGDTHVHLHLPPTAGRTPLPLLDYIVIAELDDVNVSQIFPPPAIGQIELIAGAKGQLIATRFGTPHLMGIQAEGGQRSGVLHVGMERIVIVAKRTDNGQPLAMQNLVCENAGESVVFMQRFPSPSPSHQGELHIHVH